MRTAAAGNAVLAVGAGLEETYPVRPVQVVSIEIRVAYDEIYATSGLVADGVPHRVASSHIDVVPAEHQLRCVVFGLPLLRFALWPELTLAYPPLSQENVG